MIASKKAFGLVETVAVLTILSSLLAIAIPVALYTRERSRTTACKYNLRQLGLASNIFHDAHGRFPPADTLTAYDWQVAILPFAENDALASKLKAEKSLFTPTALSTARTSQPAFYRCPSNPIGKAALASAGDFPAIHYSYNLQVAGETTISQRSNTILFQEAPARIDYVHPWMIGSTCTSCDGEFGEVPLSHTSGVLLGYADGRVEYFSRPGN